jgi:hypothetical protein
VWLPVVAVADVLVVASGSWRWLDALGVAALAGVLAQAVLATLIYLTPMLRGRTPDTRDRLRQRLEVGMRARVVAYNAGVATCVVGATRSIDGVPLVAVGWSTVILVVVATLITGAWPVPAAEVTG